MKDSCLSPKLLERYFDEEVSPEERAVVENHLISCTGCQERLKLMGAVREAIKRPVEEALEKETFPWVWEKIEREIQKEQTPPWWESVRSWLATLPLFQRKAWVPALAISIVLLFITAQVFLKKIPSHSDRTVVEYLHCSYNNVMIYQLEKKKVTIIWLFEKSESEVSPS